MFFKDKIDFMNFDIKAKKKFGQNFLKDKNILKKISNVVDIENKNILEIGPGQGDLTSFLIKKAKKVVAFEIDRDLIDFLNEKFRKEDNLEIINQDFLEANLSDYKEYLIIANIPYNISTDIVFKIFENYKNFSDVVLLVQKEFGQRLCANPNSKEYSKLSISTKLFYEPKFCFEVQPKFFIPQPKVTSSVIYLKRVKNSFDIDYNNFLFFIKKCFSMRRKTLWNNLKYLKINYDDFKNLMKNLEINENARPENLTFEQYLEIFKKLTFN